MVFNSIAFVIFFIVFFTVYWPVCRKYSPRATNLLILAGSYIFYGWWDKRFLLLIIISSLADYLIGQKIHASNSLKTRKVFLFLSVLINLSLLGFFKYFNFFIESFRELAWAFNRNPGFSTLDIILPVGISFYTFQTLGYTIDVYRRQIEPARDPIAFFSFVSFFPQLVAGPIERAKFLLPQFYEKKTFSYPKAVQGFRLVMWGLFKKIAIADNLGPVVDILFDPANTYEGITVIAAGILFAIQIYCDFSGYSDIAIGIARSMGFDLMSNFQTPFFSRSFSELWKRWHTSLSTWFRDYVYIPLGGNRGSSFQKQANLVVTFTLSGFWHGAGINFIAWGTLHGLILVTERWAEEKMQFPARRLKPIFVFLVFSLCLVPFRSTGLVHIWTQMERLLNWNTNLATAWNLFVLQFSATKSISLFICIAALFLAEWKMGMLNFSEWIERNPKPVRMCTYYLLMILIVIMGNFDVKPNFIYFQF